MRLIAKPHPDHLIRGILPDNLKSKSLPELAPNYHLSIGLHCVRWILSPVIIPFTHIPSPCTPARQHHLGLTYIDTCLEDTYYSHCTALTYLRWRSLRATHSTQECPIVHTLSSANSLLQRFPHLFYFLKRTHCLVDGGWDGYGTFVSFHPMSFYLFRFHKLSRIILFFFLPLLVLTSFGFVVSFWLASSTLAVDVSMLFLETHRLCSYFNSWL